MSHRLCLLPSEQQLERPWYRMSDTDERNALARRAYETLLTLTLKHPDSDKYTAFSKALKKRSLELFKGSDVFETEDEVNTFVGSFHDGVVLFALALNKTLQAGVPISNGTFISRGMWNRTIEGTCLF